MARVSYRDHTVLPATHTRAIPAFTPQPQTITAFGWYSCAYLRGMARLSWPGWLVIFWDILRLCAVSVLWDYETYINADHRVKFQVTSFTINTYTFCQW